MKFLTIFCISLILVGCGKSSKLPSIRDGNSKNVSCFFSSASAYRDIVFNVSYDAKNKSATLKFLNLDTQKTPIVIAETDTRLSIQFTNSQKEQILLSIFHETGQFEMSTGGNSMYGNCEEIK